MVAEKRPTAWERKADCGLKSVSVSVVSVIFKRGGKAERV
jgi:hypothetical protein